jgi:hypothetical protein
VEVVAHYTIRQYLHTAETTHPPYLPTQNLASSNRSCPTTRV